MTQSNAIQIPHYRLNWHIEKHIVRNRVYIFNNREYSTSSSSSSLPIHIMNLQDDTLIKILADFKDHLSPDMQKDLKVPSIVVLGVENNGKSSLLSRIIGLNILPISNGTCTKCPIEVTIVHNSALEQVFKLSISKEIVGDQFEPYKFYETTEEKEPHSLLLSNVESIRDQVTSVVEHICDERIRQKTTINETDFSDKSIRIRVESSDFKVSLSFTDVPGYTIKDTDIQAALDKIYTKTMKNDEHSIVLWVHQATSVMGGTCVNAQFVEKMLGSRWKSRVVGVLTKVDGTDAIKIAEGIINGTDGNVGVRWFGVINKSSHISLTDTNDYYSELEAFETIKLKELLGESVDDSRLGVSVLRNYLASELIYKMKDLLRGDRFKMNFKSALQECESFLNNEPEFTPFATSAYHSFINKVSIMIRDSLLSQSLLANSLKELPTSYKDLIFNQVIFPLELEEYYQLIVTNMNQSGGLELSVGVSQDLMRDLLSIPRETLYKQTLEFMSQYYREAMTNLKEFVDKNTIVREENEEFKSYFLARLDPNESDSSYGKRYTNIRSIVDTVFNSGKNILFPGDQNATVNIYASFTSELYRMVAMKHEENLKRYMGSVLAKVSPTQREYAERALEFSINNVKQTPASTQEHFFKVMDTFVKQVASLAYILTQMLPALLYRMLIEGTENLAETYNAHKIALGVYYDKEKRATYDDYAKKKPFFERKKRGLEELKKKYPDIL